MGVRAFAFCRGCGAFVRDSAQFMPIEKGTLVLTETGSLAVVAHAPFGCRICGGAQIEIRIERVTLDA